jgi:metal-sulfur cluster biosynthetic enzyme
MVSLARAADGRIEAAWRALEAVEDPEIPAVSIVDMGLIR